MESTYLTKIRGKQLVVWMLFRRIELIKAIQTSLYYPGFFSSLEINVNPACQLQMITTWNEEKENLNRFWRLYLPQYWNSGSRQNLAKADYRACIPCKKWASRYHLHAWSKGCVPGSLRLNSPERSSQLVIFSTDLLLKRKAPLSYNILFLILDCRLHLIIHFLNYLNMEPQVLFHSIKSEI